MQAVYFEEFGDSQKLKIGPLPEPKLGADEVLIRLSHTSVNPVDWKIGEGYLQEMLPHHFPLIPGWDASGVVEQVGEAVKGFKAGDAVFSYARLPEVQHGTYAEKIALPANQVAHKPKSVTAEQAAAIPLTALTAWQGVHEVLQVRSGQTVLVTAGAGGVGSFAVQFAKLAGAVVIATASKKNHAYLKELGADHVIDYTQGEVAKEVRLIAPGGVDAAFDAAGNEALEEAISVVAKGGKLVSIVSEPQGDIDGSFLFVRPEANQLKKIAELIDAEKLKLPAIKTANIRQAGSYLDGSRQGHTRGKVVLEIAF